MGEQGSGETRPPRFNEDPPPGSSSRWQRRPLAASVLWLVALGAPVLAAVLASLAVATLLPEPATAVAAALWWFAVLATPPVVLVVVGRAARRLLPLATLLKLSLTFPDRAPSRFVVAREAHTVAQLRRGAAGDKPLAFDQTPATATTILALVTDLQRHDRATRGHSERVRVYVELIAEELALAPSRRERLAWAALLHDVGKLTVPASLLNKPGPPDADEWSHLRRHPQEGMRLVSPLGPWLGSWVDGIGDHHERYDGTGYPRGVAEEDISLAGRIVAVADAFETMTAARPYKRPVGIRQARSELVRAAGSHFDPKVIRAFLNVSVGRLRWTLGPVAWLGTLPFLPRFRRLSDSGVQAVLTATTVVGMAAGGVLAPALGPSIEERSSPRAALDAPPGVTAEEALQPEEAEPDVPPPPPFPQPLEGPPPGPVAPEPPLAQPGGPLTVEQAAPPPGSPGSAAPAAGAPAPPFAPNQPRLSNLLTLALYLDSWQTGDATSQPTLPLSPEVPRRAGLANYDVDRDGAPGLLLRPSTLGRAETDPARRAKWVTTLDRPGVLAGFPKVTFWSALADSAAGRPAAVDVFLEACDPGLVRCQPIGQGRIAESDWSRGQPRWVRRTVDIGLAAALMEGEHALVLTFAADAAVTPTDLWLAFGTRDFPAVLRVPTLLPPNLLPNQLPILPPR
ncbi:MAG: HD-GYP domain-containing protein [Actinomycetota bacterium]|nr:HD-GYP domain-containing protein [Actinomycetota bacterium]